jgi:hypothetical protein
MHALTRDPVNDYGMDWLEMHHQEAPPGPMRALVAALAAARRLAASR